MSWKRFFLRNHWDNERKQELEQHLQLEIDENLARGMSLNEAESAAHRKLGNSTQIREEVYRFNSLQFLETIWQDLKIGVEHLRAWKRTALVTDIAWMSHLSHLFGWMTPGEAKTFPLDQKDQAIEWVRDAS